MILARERGSSWCCSSCLGHEETGERVGLIEVYDSQAKGPLSRRVFYAIMERCWETRGRPFVWGGMPQNRFGMGHLTSTKEKSSWRFFVMNRNGVIPLVVLLLALIVGILVLVGLVLCRQQLGPQLTTIVVVSLLGFLGVLVREVLRILGLLARPPVRDED